MERRRGTRVAEWAVTLGVVVVVVVGLGGCITPEDDDFGGADTDPVGKASASATPTSGSGDDTTGGSDPSASDDESDTNVPSTSGTTGGDTDSTSSFTTAVDDTGSSDDSAGVTTASDDSSGSSTGVGVVTFAANIQPIINANCGCHQGGGTAGQLVMDAGVAYDNLVGVQSTQAAGVVRVEPMDPAASYLFHKLSGTQADVGGSGNQMPPGGPLNADQVMLVEQWILDGAMP